jgi:transketolase
MESVQIRRIILQQAKRAKVGHIGSALSVADIISVLYGSVLRITDAGHPDRDRFILSNGHSALALYAALYLKGWLTGEDLEKYCTDDSLLGVHPECKVNGIDFCTGSLGHGLTYGAGAALAARLQKSLRRIYVLLSDGECNEGSVWEAVMFAAHHNLSNLVVIIDLNGQQALGYTDQVLNLNPMVDRWKAFGWDTHEADGHNVKELTDEINSLITTSGPPHVIIASTVLGKGVSFMEHQIKWHYWPMSDEEYHQAIHEIETEK